MQAWGEWLPTGYFESPEQRKRHGCAYKHNISTSVLRQGEHTHKPGGSWERGWLKVCQMILGIMKTTQG